MNYEHGLFPVIILVDISTNDEVTIKRAVNDVHKSLMNEPLFKECGDMSLVYYGNSVKIMPFVPVKEYKIGNITNIVMDKADLGMALSKTIDWIYERKQLYKSASVGCKRPRVIVLSGNEQLAFVNKNTMYKIHSNIEMKYIELMIFIYGNNNNISLLKEFYPETLRARLPILKADYVSIYKFLEGSLAQEYDGEICFFGEDEIYYGKNNAVYRIGEFIMENGQSKYWSINGNDEIIAKLFKMDGWKEENIKKLERKIKAMLQLNVNPYINNKPFLEWPLDILYNSCGNMQGIISTRISNKNDVNLCDIQRFGRADKNNASTTAVLSVFPNFTWKYSVQIAYNLAGLVEYLHSFDIILGAFHLNDFLIDTNTGNITCRDCDRWGCYDDRTGEVFRSDLWIPEMMAPEWILRNNLGNSDKKTDDFALATVIFRLLMNNADPFGGVKKTYISQSYCGVGENIILGNCPYVRECDLIKPKWAPGLEILPVQIQNAFRRTFEYDETTAVMSANNRTSAREWREVLYTIAAPEPNRNLCICKNNKYHVYPVHNKMCPWCAQEEKRHQITFCPPPEVNVFSGAIPIVILIDVSETMKVLMREINEWLLMVKKTLIECEKHYPVKADISVISFSDEIANSGFKPSEYMDVSVLIEKNGKMELPDAFEEAVKCVRERKKIYREVGLPTHYKSGVIVISDQENYYNNFDSSNRIKVDRDIQACFINFKRKSQSALQQLCCPIRLKDKIVFVVMDDFLREFFGVLFDQDIDSNIDYGTDCTLPPLPSEIIEGIK